MAAKTIVVFRHGQGNHQIGVPEVHGLGHKLTLLGRQQAADVGQHPIVAQALARAQNPLFVSSHLIRAIETMALAVPGKRIVVHPDAREVGCRGGQPKELAKWAQSQGCELDLSLYMHEIDLHKGDYNSYCRAVADQDHEACCMGPVVNAYHRGNDLMKWMAQREEDTIFLAAHGGLLAIIDGSNSGCCGLLDGFCKRRCIWKNCEIREFKLAQKGTRSDEWRLQRIAPPPLLQFLF